MTAAAVSPRPSFGRTSSSGQLSDGDKTISSLVYVFTATLFVLTALASFAPTSIALIARVYAGQQPLPPFVVHFHAASMSLWLLLLLAQSILGHTGKRRIHKRLGLLSLFLAPAILVSMYGMDLWGIATFNVRDTVVASAVSPLEESARLQSYAATILLIHGASYLLFPVFYLWAILARRRDNETHK